MSNIGNPAPLGLLAFGMTTLMLMYVEMEWVEKDFEVIVAGTAMALGGAGQVLVAIFEVLKGSSFSFAVFGCYGFFWIGWSLVYFERSRTDSTFGEASYQDGLTLWFTQWGILTTCFWVITWRKNHCLIFVFSCLMVTFFLLAAANARGSDELRKVRNVVDERASALVSWWWWASHNRSFSCDCMYQDGFIFLFLTLETVFDLFHYCLIFFHSQAGGYFGFVTAAGAFYTGVAELINEEYGRHLLPGLLPVYRPQRVDITTETVSDLIDYDSNTNTLLLQFRGLQIKTLEQVQAVETAVENAILAAKSPDNRVHVVADYNCTFIADDVQQAYWDMAKSLETKYYLSATRFNVSSFGTVIDKPIAVPSNLTRG